MVFKTDKFEHLKHWPNRDTKPATTFVSDPAGNSIEEKSWDLGFYTG